MKFHPYSEVFPLLEGGSFDELVSDIKAHGLREPVWLYEGQILDGRNRFLACQRAKVKLQTRKYTGDDALSFVVSLNVARRHLTESQRAMAAAQIATLRKGANQHTARAASSQAQAAETFGVSTDSIQRAKKVIEHGSKALQKAVQSGEITVKKAATVTALPKPEQLAAATASKPSVTDDDWAPDEDEGAYIEQLEKEQSASLDKILAADDRLAAAHTEIKRQAAEIAVLRLARDGYMNAKGEITRLLKSEQRKVERLEKQLLKAEGDNEKLRERVSIMEAA